MEGWGKRMSETGHRTRYRYTIYREPEHRVIMAGRPAYEVERWFLANEPGEISPATGWDYLRKRLIEGKVRGYSLARSLPESAPKEARTEPWVRTWTPNPVKLCGDCRHWQRGRERDRSGKLYGVCGKTEEKSERCQECKLAAKGKRP